MEQPKLKIIKNFIKANGDTYNLFIIKQDDDDFYNYFIEKQNYGHLYFVVGIPDLINLSKSYVMDAIHQAENDGFWD